VKGEKGGCGTKLPAQALTDQGSGRGGRGRRRRGQLMAHKNSPSFLPLSSVPKM